jgi:poly(hydroxyalkanoate) depolymerase family esterase
MRKKTSFDLRPYSGSAGRRAYRLCVPPGIGAGDDVPLIVMLHGCTQDAADFAAGTRMNDFARANRFIVAYPEQPADFHAQKCWNWYDPANHHRDAGEPSLIAGIAREVIAAWPVDPSRVYLAGISAGAAMAALTGAAYPDVFAAIALHSGVEHGAASTLASALYVLQNGGPDPAARGSAAFDAMGEHARPMPVLVLHGESDAVVRPVNGAQAVEQWIETNRLAGADVGEPILETIDGATVASYRDAAGNVLVEHWRIATLGHAWSGGSAAGTYTSPDHVDAGPVVIRFLLHHALEGATAQ